MTLVSIDMTIGFLAALLIAHVLSGMLYGVAATDPVSLLAAASSSAASRCWRVTCRHAGPLASIRWSRCARHSGCRQQALEHLNLSGVIRVMLGDTEDQLPHRPALSTVGGLTVPRGGTFAMAASSRSCSDRSSETSSAQAAASAGSATFGQFAGLRGKRSPFPPSRRRRTAYFQYAMCSASCQMLFRPGRGTHAAWSTVTPRNAASGVGPPCQPPRPLRGWTFRSAELQSCQPSCSQFRLAPDAASRLTVTKLALKLTLTPILIAATTLPSSLLNQESGSGRGISSASARVNA